VGGRALVGAPACDKGVLDSPDNYEMYEIPFVWVIYESAKRASAEGQELSGLFATRDVLYWREGRRRAGSAIMASIY